MAAIPMLLINVKGKLREPAIYRVLACQLHITGDFTLVDDEHVGVRVGDERLLQPPLLAGVGEVLDEFRRRGEKRLDTVLGSAIADGHRQMGLAASGSSGTSLTPVSPVLSI